jgi:hypothetical protein
MANGSFKNTMNPMLIGKQRNLMGAFDSDGEIPGRVNIALKHQIDTAPNRSKKVMEINKLNTTANCIRSK